MFETIVQAIVTLLCCSGLIFSLLYGVKMDHYQHRKDIEELNKLFDNIKENNK